MVRRQDAGELPKPISLGRDLRRPAAADGAADAAVPVPAAMVSDVLAATAATSTAIKPAFGSGRLSEHTEVHVLVILLS